MNDTNKNRCNINIWNVRQGQEGCPAEWGEAHNPVGRRVREVEEAASRAGESQQQVRVDGLRQVRWEYGSQRIRRPDLSQRLGYFDNDKLRNQINVILFVYFSELKVESGAQMEEIDSSILNDAMREIVKDDDEDDDDYNVYLLNDEEKQKRSAIWEKNYRGFMDERKRKQKEREAAAATAGGDMYTQSGKLKKKYAKRAKSGGMDSGAARTAAEAAMHYVGQYIKPSSNKINYEALKVNYLFFC